MMSRSRSLPRGLRLASPHLRPGSRSRSPCPRPLPVVLTAPSCSISVAPRVFPSRALPWPRLIAWSLLAATPAPRPLPPALSSHGVRLVWLAASHRPSRVLQLLIPPRPLLGRQVRGVVPQAPLKHGNAGGTSTAAGCGATPNDRCGARFSVKHPRHVQCGFAAPTPRPMMTTTTRATPCCSCSQTPSSRPLYLRTSLRWDIFTIAQQDRPQPEPDLLAHDLGCGLWF